MGDTLADLKKKKEEEEMGDTLANLKKKKEKEEMGDTLANMKKKKKEKEEMGDTLANMRKRKHGDLESPKAAKKHKGKAAGAAPAATEPGTCSFPMARVRVLMRDKDATIRSNTETVFLVNKASELFLEAFVEDAYQNALKGRKKSIAYDNLSAGVCNEKRYKFLSDFVPLRVTAGDALKAVVERS
nr:predicted protein [Hordeum vulgare subsp. vulgare]